MRLEAINEHIKNIDKTIGNRLYYSRTKLGLSRQEVAYAAGVSPQQLAKYERGIDKLSIGRLDIIARFMGLDFIYFYPGNEIKMDLERASGGKRVTELHFRAIEELLQLTNERSLRALLILLEKLH